MTGQGIPKQINISVTVEEQTFRRFALFDTFKRLKRWRSPLLFMGILLAFAAVCFIVRDRPQAMFMGCVLTTLALGLTAVYFGTFFHSLQARVKLLGLPKRVYELELSDAPDGVFIRSLTKDGESQRLKWADMHAAYRDTGCVYLFALPAKGYLLPDGQANVPDESLWQLIEQQMPSGKCHDVRKKHAGKAD